MTEIVSAKWSKHVHLGAVKVSPPPSIQRLPRLIPQALAWCPWQPSILASGGGSADKKIHIWSTTTSERLQTLDAGSQVTSLHFSPHSRELLSTHGYPQNNISVWSYPSLEKVYDRSVHSERVLSSALSPDGCSIGTAASDETLKFWRIWEVPAKRVGEVGSERRMLMGIR